MQSKFVMLFAGFLLAGASQAQPAPGGQGPGGQGPGQGPGGHHGPPAEVLNACKGKKEGDTAQIKTPRGDTIAGRCRLVLVPEMGQGQQVQRQGAPR
ncbi:hypothetical protein V8J88_03260 [Massilia sp. W12]|uniref:hypothetical protein n=1 Tax=Massilia sp. W12 TaxID=3126507 RepID=UPI0030D3E58F